MLCLRVTWLVAVFCQGGLALGGKLIDTFTHASVIRFFHPIWIPDRPCLKHMGIYHFSLTRFKWDHHGFCQWLARAIRQTSVSAALVLLIRFGELRVKEINYLEQGCRLQWSVGERLLRCFDAHMRNTHTRYTEAFAEVLTNQRSQSMLLCSTCNTKSLQKCKVSYLLVMQHRLDKARRFGSFTVLENANIFR